MTFNSVWTVINLDESISNDTIQSWISFAGIPACFRFVFQSPFANAWTTFTAYDSSVPMPLAPWTICVSSATDARFTWTVAGLSTIGLHQASIGHWTGEPQDDLGARMWHEILHCYELPADNMQTSERAEFADYLRTTGSLHAAGFSADPVGYEASAHHTQILVEYYKYLMHKYMGCDCFQEGCGEQPVVPSEDGSTPSSGNEDAMKKLLYIGGAVVFFLLIL